MFSSNFIFPPLSTGIRTETSGPLYYHGFSLIPAWIIDYIHYDMCDEITKQTSMVIPLKFGNG